ncbi:MAG: hypothetical protein JW786_01300 [Desulfobacterales bacterium]|nr:hypothetical protein [Desulfobacterales bacterium]
MMKKQLFLILVIMVVGIFIGCSTSYKVKPLPFKTPAAFNNVVTIDGAQMGSKAFDNPSEAKEAFGFDIRGAGMLPVQVVFDNQGRHALEINGQQTFLEDKKGNLWPILSRDIAYERATKYAQSKQIVTEGAYKGFWGAAAGSIIGAAIGIVAGENVAAAAGKGAAIGAAAGATIGGAEGYTSDDARRTIVKDLREKSLQNMAIEPKSLAHGFLFFPGEAESALRLRIQIMEKDTGKIHVMTMNF